MPCLTALDPIGNRSRFGQNIHVSCVYRVCSVLSSIINTHTHTHTLSYDLVFPRIDRISSKKSVMLTSWTGLIMIRQSMKISRLQ